MQRQRIENPRGHLQVETASLPLSEALINKIVSHTDPTKKNGSLGLWGPKSTSIFLRVTLPDWENLLWHLHGGEGQPCNIWKLLTTHWDVEAATEYWASPKSPLSFRRIHFSFPLNPAQTLLIESRFFPPFLGLGRVVMTWVSISKRTLKLWVSL